jgi:hypothetical protein
MGWIVGKVLLHEKPTVLNPSSRAIQTVKIGMRLDCFKFR